MFNRDQVPIAMWGSQDRTLERRGSKTVWTVDKTRKFRDATLDLTIPMVIANGRWNLPKPILIFRSDSKKDDPFVRERHLFDKDVIVLHQRKAWVDTRTNLAVMEKTFLPIQKELAKRNKHGIIFEDNHGPHVTHRSKSYRRIHLPNFRYRNYEPNTTCILQCVDRHIGTQFQVRVHNDVAKRYIEWATRDIEEEDNRPSLASLSEPTQGQEEEEEEENGPSLASLSEPTPGQEEEEKEEENRSPSSSPSSAALSEPWWMDELRKMDAEDNEEEQAVVDDNKNAKFHLTASQRRVQMTHSIGTIFREMTSNPDVFRRSFVATGTWVPFTPCGTDHCKCCTVDLQLDNYDYLERMETVVPSIEERKENIILGLCRDAVDELVSETEFQDDVESGRKQSQIATLAIRNNTKLCSIVKTIEECFGSRWCIGGSFAANVVMEALQSPSPIPPADIDVYVAKTTTDQYFQIHFVEIHSAKICGLDADVVPCSGLTACHLLRNNDVNATAAVISKRDGKIVVTVAKSLISFGADRIFRPLRHHTANHSTWIRLVYKAYIHSCGFVKPTAEQIASFKGLDISKTVRAKLSEIRHWDQYPFFFVNDDGEKMTMTATDGGRLKFVIEKKKRKSKRAVIYCSLNRCTRRSAQKCTNGLCKPHCVSSGNSCDVHNNNNPVRNNNNPVRKRAKTKK